MKNLDLPDMGHEYDRDKPPNPVQTRVFFQGGYIIKADLDRPYMGL